MFKNYLTIAIRNILRQKFYSFINILGLAVGLACCLLILSYVNHEYQYDQHHQNIDRLHRILLKKRGAGGEYFYFTHTAGKLPETLQAEYPEVEYGLRTFVRWMFVTGNQRTYSQWVCIADAHIMDMFTFPLVAGDPNGLKTAYGAFITQSLAQKLFGDADPLGKQIKTDYKWGLEGEYTITGILADMPETATYDLQFDMLTSTIPPKTEFENRWLNWRTSIKSYVMLKPGAKAKALEPKLAAVMEKYWDKELAQHRSYHLQPVSQIHLHSESDYGILHGTYGDIGQIRTVLLIGGIILLIACVNFMNLTTAQSMRRVREVGMRKVVGALRRQLINQFFFESISMAFLALILALGFVALSLPYLSGLLNQNVTFDHAQFTMWIPIVFCITLATGFISGSYPALFLSRFQPIDALKGTSKGEQKNHLRRLLVVFQFAAAVTLVIGTSIAYKQIVYIQNKNLGFQKEQMALIPIFSANRDLNERSETIKQAFLQHPNVQHATATWNLPGRENLADITSIKNTTKNIEARIAMMYTDQDFFDTYNIPLLAGKTFTGDKPTWNEVIFNETAVRLLQLLKNPVGTEVEMWGGGRWKVIGVAKDFHNRSLRDPIGPMVIVRYHRFRHVNLKIGMGDFENTLAFFKEQWKRFVPHKQFSFQFMDEYFNGHYQQETRMRQFLSIFSLLAIFISCLGVLSLSAYAAEQRTKEVGIRKVLGASTHQIITILSKELFILIAIANLIAWPIAYWTMNQWLQDFAYHTDLSIWIFALAGVFTATIAGGISGYQALKVANTNPVDALRYE